MAFRATAAGLIATAAVIGILAHQSASSSASSFSEARAPGGHRPLPPLATPSASSIGEPRPGGPGGAPTEADGVVPEGVTVFDEAYPGVANLDPDLLRAVRTAASDAAHDGIEFSVTSGWRSREYQDQLLGDAVSRYGSVKEAARWVATAETSAHVSGEAIDLAADATAWLSEHGAGYGLCQVYANEPWHYELRPRAVERGCPAMYADPTQDPR